MSKLTSKEIKLKLADALEANEAVQTLVQQHCEEYNKDQLKPPSELAKSLMRRHCPDYDESKPIPPEFISPEDWFINIRTGKRPHSHAWGGIQERIFKRRFKENFNAIKTLYDLENTISCNNNSRAEANGFGYSIIVSSFNDALLSEAEKSSGKATKTRPWKRRFHYYDGFGSNILQSGFIDIFTTQDDSEIIGWVWIKQKYHEEPCKDESHDHPPEPESPWACSERGNTLVMYPNPKYKK